MNRSFTTRILFSTLLFISISLPSFASHIIGGDISVRYLSPNNYQVTVTFFRDCTSGTGYDNPMYVGVYDKATNIQNQIINMGAPTVSAVTLGDACYTPTICLEKGVYVANVVLANNANGYYLTWLRCCRNATIDNIVTPGDDGYVLYAEVADPAIVNSSPVFNVIPDGYMCATYLNTDNFSATDADGDQLIYSFSTPLSCSPTLQCDNLGNPLPSTSIANLPGPYGTIVWGAGYSLANPMGDPAMTIGSSTGIMTGTPPILGTFVICVKVEEWRGGVKIGEIRRDFQFQVLTCQILSINVSPTTTVCQGEVATLTGSGALPGWTYSWNSGSVIGPTITGMSLVNGITSYTCIATNGGPCIMNVGSFVTNSPTAAVATAGNVCAGQNTTLTASGGGTYSWSGAGGTAAALTGVANGQYTVTVTNGNGCTDDAVGTVYQAPVLSSTVAVNNVNCAGTGGSASYSVSGGSPTYTYSWSTGQTTTSVTGISNGVHTVTVTDTKGCTLSKSFTIAATATPNVSMSSNPGGCTVANGNATASASVGGGAPYTYLWGNGQTTSTATGLSAGSTYSVVVTSSNGCTKSNSVTISSTTPPTISTTSTTVGGCGVPNGTAYVNASGGTGGYSYSWSGGGQTTQTATGLTGGSYTITVTDANGCSVAGTASVATTSAPAISTITATPAGCGMLNGTATATATGGTGAYTYNWAGGQTTQTATGLAGGNYSLTVTDAQGCTGTGTISITNTGAPSISNITASSFGCSSPYGVATVSVFGGTPGYTFIWSPGGQTTQTATGLASGNYAVTVTDAGNCSVSSTVSVTVNTAPSTSVTSTQSTCGNNNGTASVSFNGGTPGYTYQWSNGGTTSAISNLAPGSYSVTVSDNSCNISGIELVTNGDFSAGDVGFSSTYTVCVPNCDEGSYSVGPDPNAVHIAWASCGDHTTGTGNFMIVNGAGTPGTDVWCQTVAVTPNTNYTFSTWVVSQYTISPSQLQFSINGSPLCAVFSAPSTSCTWTQFFCTWNSGANTSANICILNQNTILSGNDFGLDDISFQSCTPCTATATVTVTQPSALTVATSQVNPLCNGLSTGSASVNPSAGTPNYAYNWSSGQTTSAITGITAGNYTAIVTDANGCSNTNTFTITQPTLLSSSTAQTAILCNGNTANASVTPAGGTPGYTYNWNNGQTTSALSGIAAGNYSVLITDANGCTSTNSLSITQPALLTSTTTQSAILCNGGTANASVSAAGGTTGYTYTWNNGQTTSAIAGVAAGNYSVTVTDANGCTSTSILSITQPAPLVLSSSCNDSICAGDTTILSVNASGGTPNYTYVWLPGPQGGQSISVSPSSNTNYFVTTTDANGCVSSAQTCSVSVLPSPNANFDTLSNGMYGAIYSFNDLSSGGTDWFWDFGDGNTSTAQNPIHTFPGAGTYTVTQVVFNQFGCPDTFKIVLDFEDGILIPNVFTPDGDGINDVWFIPNSGLKEFHVDIFDRWGLKVFETTADEIRWDGHSSSGKLLSDGTYYYVLKAILKSFNGDKDYSQKGYVTLLTAKRKQ